VVGQNGLDEEGHRVAAEVGRYVADSEPPFGLRAIGVLPDQACQRRLETQVASSLGTRNSVNVQREAEIRAALDAQKKRLLGLRSQRDELAVLQREV
jgi:hypothetical protein